MPARNPPEDVRWPGRSRRRLVCHAVAVAVLLFFAQGALAQSLLTPLAPPDTSSPRATLVGFISALDEAYENARTGIEADSLQPLLRATRALDLTAYPHLVGQDRGIEAALLLKEVLDRIPLPPVDQIPNAAAVRAADGDTAIGQLVDALDGEDGPARGGAGTGPIEHWTVPGTQINIVRLTEGPRQGEFLFSADTVEQIESYYELVRHLPYKLGATPNIYDAYITTPGKGLNLLWGEWFPAWSRQVFWSQTVWQWGAAGGLILALVALSCLLIRWALARDRVPADLTPVDGRPVWRVWSILAVGSSALATFVVQDLIDNVINITGGLLFALIEVFIVVRFALLAWFIALLIAQIADLVIAGRKLPQRSPRSHLIRFGARLMALVAVVAVVVLAAQEIGLPVYSVVTGLGIGGLAVAFAAQESLGAMIGSLMIMIDRPFRVGDHVVVAGAEGIVEDIGFRSTKIRTLNDSLLSIPNSQMAAATVENLGARTVHRVSETFEIRDDTPLATVESFLDGLRQILRATPAARSTDAVVCMPGFGVGGLLILVEYSLDVRDLAAERAERQKIFMQILRLAERLEIGFAPNQAIELAMTPGAAARVRDVAVA